MSTIENAPAPDLTEDIQAHEWVFVIFELNAEFEFEEQDAPEGD